MVDLYLSVKLIEISSNDILSYRKEEVNFSQVLSHKNSHTSD